MSGILAMFVLLCSATLAHSEPQEKCLDGQYHKASPEPQGASYKACEPWQNKSCCTANFTVELVNNQTQTLYNHSWHRCGKLSDKCEKFWVEQECFYQCSPYLYPWKDPAIKGAIKGVPICASYCDAWFDACKDDRICVEDVLGGYNFTVHGENICPAPKNCTTYEQRYRNAQGLCNKMWGSSYVYTKEDGNNCMKIWFNGSNPNANVPKPVPATDAPTVAAAPTHRASSATAIMIAFAVALKMKLFP